MRFFLTVIDSHSRAAAEANALATSNEMAAIDEFNDSLRANGHWIMACGVHDPAMSVVIDNRADAGVVVEGPLHDTDEFMAGFWLIQADSAEVARELATAGSKACNRKVEVRQLHGD
jgi:hypothetical protein